MSLLFLLPGLSFAQTGTNQKIVDDARAQYSVLRRQGLMSFTASVTPNWEPLLTEVPTEERLTALRFARRLRFSVKVDAVAGTVNVSHTLLGPKPAKVRLEALESIARGMDLSINGFFQTWMPVMITHVIPEQPEQFVFQDLGNSYVLSFFESSTNVSIDMTKDFRITELRTPMGSVRPELSRTTNGFVMTGYEGDFEAPNLGRVTFKSTITSAPVQGMSMPAKIVLVSTIGTGQNRVELAFSNYRVRFSHGFSRMKRIKQKAL